MKYPMTSIAQIRQYLSGLEDTGIDLTGLAMALDFADLDPRIPEQLSAGLRLVQLDPEDFGMPPAMQSVRLDTVHSSGTGSDLVGYFRADAPTDVGHWAPGKLFTEPGDICDADTAAATGGWQATPFNGAPCAKGWLNAHSSEIGSTVYFRGPSHP